MRNFSMLSETEALHPFWSAIYREIVITLRGTNRELCHSIARELNAFDGKLLAYELAGSHADGEALCNQITWMIQQAPLSQYVSRLQALQKQLAWTFSPDRAIEATPIPADILLYNVASYMTLGSLQNLACTSRFFNHDENIKNEIAKKWRKTIIAAGGSHTLVLQNGLLSSCGSNDYGQLGLGHSTNQITLQFISFFQDKQPILMVVGDNHSLVLCEDGLLYAFGRNNKGQLGLGHFDDQHTPQCISFFQDKQPILMAVGDNHSLVLCEDGLLYAFGENDRGQLGLGHFDDQNTPQFISFFQDKKPILMAVGCWHSLVICEDGSLYGFGYNHQGQLGLGHVDDQHTPQFISFFQDKKPILIAASGRHNLVLCEDGSLYAFGDNSYGQLGLGHFYFQNTPQFISFFQDKKPILIAAGYWHSLVLCEDGSLYAFGFNSYGQLGLGHNYSRNTPQCISFFQDKKPILMAVGICYSLVLCENGSLYAFGDNDRGQLGLVGCKINQHTPQLISLLACEKQTSSDPRRRPNL